MKILREHPNANKETTERMSDLIGRIWKGRRREEFVDWICDMSLDVAYGIKLEDEWRTSEKEYGRMMRTMIKAREVLGKIRNLEE